MDKHSNYWGCLRSAVILGVVFLCSVVRCQQVVKLFQNHQRISEVLKTKPLTNAGTGKKRGRQTKENSAADTASSGGGGKSATGLLSIGFISTALTALFGHVFN